MLDVDIELARLRWKLHDKGYDYSYIDAICRSANEEISNSILDIVSNASAEAVSYAENIGATDFFADIDVVQLGTSSFAIKTRSGRTDYSIDRVENLNNLLKNAKTAPDGSKYKVIPVKDKPKMGTSSFENMREQSRVAKVARENLANNTKARISEKANAIADQMRANAQGMMKKDTGGAVHMYTASSKQNAGSQWVIPEIDRDMTQYLNELNDNINTAIDYAIYDTVNRYDQEFS